IGDSIHVKDLSLPSGWEVLVEGNPIVLMVSRSRMVVEDRPAGAPAEGAAAPAAGAAAPAADKK
ncbi:MAG: 50S ribosomal protein L25, partial [Spirochaetia bacterium]|nr:50S ribosomal protein L25 [Spirochaetia bacterium]